jgi:hypothetical protein
MTRGDHLLEILEKNTPPNIERKGSFFESITSHRGMKAPSVTNSLRSYSGLIIIVRLYEL